MIISTSRKNGLSFQSPLQLRLLD
uniref:Uncharacterized protein n=1 Tax=Anguilla anguilla TaxID=7936 RepID=A0A0E9R879_ANGAN